MLQAMFGLLLSVLILVFKEEFLSIFNIETPQIIEYALMYIPIIGGLIFIQFIVNGFIAINEGLGQTRINLKILAVGFVFNMILDPILILVFRLGIQGAAIATVSAQIVTLIIFFVIYKKHNPNLKVFHLKNINLAAIKQIMGIGLPVGIQSMIFTAISIFLARKVFEFGPNVVAAQRIGVQIEQLTWMIASGFQSAITVFIGQNFGAKENVRIKKGILSISYILVPYALIISLLLLFIPETLLRIFISDDETVAHGIVYLQIISASQIFMILESIGAGFFNGIGKSYIPSVVGIVGNFIRVPLVIYLTVSMFERGIWWTINISSILKGLVLILALLFFIKQLDEVKINRLKVRPKRKPELQNL